jgi:hypothetical protein
MFYHQNSVHISCFPCPICTTWPAYYNLVSGILTIDEALLNNLRNQHKNKYKSYEIETVVEEEEKIFK